VARKWEVPLADDFEKTDTTSLHILLMSGCKTGALRWKAIHVVGFDGSDVATMTLDGQGGFASGFTFSRQRNRRLDMSQISEQLASARPTWHFAGAGRAPPRESPVPELGFDVFPEPITTFDFGFGDSTWNDFWLERQ
jgi:hypothetical protein